MRRKGRFVLVLCVCMAYLSCVNVLADVKSDVYVSAENSEGKVMEDGYTEYEASVLPADEAYIEYGEMTKSNARIGGADSFQWSAKPKVRIFGLIIQLKKGELVEVNAKSTPADKSIEIGFKNQTASINMSWEEILLIIHSKQNRMENIHSLYGISVILRSACLEKFVSNNVLKSKGVQKYFLT